MCECKHVFALTILCSLSSHGIRARPFKKIDQSIGGYQVSWETMLIWSHPLFVKNICCQLFLDQTYERSHQRENAKGYVRGMIRTPPPKVTNIEMVKLGLLKELKERKYLQITIRSMTQFSRCYFLWWKPKMIPCLIGHLKHENTSRGCKPQQICLVIFYFQRNPTDFQLQQWSWKCVLLN